MFWSNSVLSQICEETNRYALEDTVQYPRRLNGRGKWTQLSVVELKALLGIYILMGLRDQPTMRFYWSKCPFLACELIKRSMKRPRFEQILSYIHLVDNESLVQCKTDLRYNKIEKCRWLIQSFVRMLKALYNCKQHVACNEIMVPYQGRRCSIKQYTKNKPVKYSIKVWCYASLRSRYIYNIIVYKG